MRHALIRSGLMGVVAVGAVAAQAGMAGAATSARPMAGPARVFVSEHGKHGAKDTSCSSAAFTSVTAAAAVVRTGGNVVVCAGRYHQDVAVTRRVNVDGRPGAVINASGKINGVLVHASRAAVSGLKVVNATGEGILVVSSNHVTIENNVVTHNDLGGQPNPVKTSYAECKTVGNTPGDCGEGIHLMGSSFATVRDNVSSGNTGGILLSDETGPTAHNHIVGNVVTNNLFDCGITVASHSPKGFVKGHVVPNAGGVYANLITRNRISGNGIKGAGAGVVLATGVPGGAVYDNTVSRNAISGNGMAGVTLHSHTPGQDLNGNVIFRNQFGINNLRGDSDFGPHHADKRTTGVLVGSVTPLSIRVADNLIVGDHFGIWTTGPVTLHHSNNKFIKVTVHLAKG